MPQAAAIHPAERPQIPLLTTLRFFAALEVLLMHLIPPSFRGWSAPLFSAGGEAIIFFFVLSGFILSYVYSGTVENASFGLPASRFWQSRLARLLPAYGVGLILTLPMFAYSTFVSHQVAPSTFWIGLVLVPLFLQTWYPPTTNAWNVAAWTLSIEWFFYALFPWLQAATSRIGRRTFLVGTWALLLAVSLFRGMNEAAYDPTAPDGWLWFGGSFPPFYLPIFLLGMAVGRVFVFGPRLSTATHVRIFLMASAAVLVLLGLRERVPSWALSTPIIVPLFCAVIFGGARIGGSFRWLTGPTFVLLGEASYALYILHTGVTFWFGWMARQLGLFPPFPFDVILEAAVAIVASVLCYLYVEVPLRRRIRLWRLPEMLRFN